MTTQQITELIAHVLINRLPADQYDNVRDDFNEVAQTGSADEMEFCEALVAAMEEEAE